MPHKMITQAKFGLIELEDVTTHSHGSEGEHVHRGWAFTTWLDPELATLQAQAVAAAATDEHALCFVSSGQPLAGHEIRIVDADGRELPERHEGYLQFRGPSTTGGYYRNPEETRLIRACFSFQLVWSSAADRAETRFDESV